MRTALFTTSYLDGQDALGSLRMDRTRRYINYYSNFQVRLGYDDIWLADDHSSWSLINRLQKDFHWVKIHRFDTRLPRGEGYHYPYVWRGTYFLRDLIEMGYEKIITCDTDAFILRPRLMKFIKELNSGYSTMWSPTYNFPAAEITVLCKDAFPKVLKWMDEKTWQERSEEKILFESAPPFTDYIRGGFIGDRYGEFINEVGGVGLAQTPEMDFYTQAQNTIPLTFNLAGHDL